MRGLKIFLVGISVCLLALAAPVFAASEASVASVASTASTYQIDPAHSSIGFSVKHLMVSTTPGNFTDFSGTINFDKETAAESSIEVAIKSASINTNLPKRDDHLRSADFFDAEKYPEITFKSIKITGESGNYTITAELTMHGVSKEISVPVSIAGPVTSPFGDEVIGISGEFALNRQDYGVKWNKTMDAGGVVVSDEVKVTVNIEAHKK